MAIANKGYQIENRPRLEKEGTHIVTGVRYTENKQGFGGTMWLDTKHGEHGSGHAIRSPQGGTDYDNIRRLAIQLEVEDVPQLDKNQRSDKKHHDLYRLLVLNIANAVEGKKLKFTRSKNTRNPDIILMNVNPV